MLYFQGDHFPDAVKFQDNFLTIRGTLADLKWYSYHASTTVIVND